MKIYTIAMTEQMKKKLDTILDQIQVLGDGLPLSHTGFVRMFRYNEDTRRLTVFTDFSGLVSKCPSCLLMSVDTEERVLQDLREKLEFEFPDTELVFG